MESFSLNVTPEKLYCTSVSTAREISLIKRTEYTWWSLSADKTLTAHSAPN